ncbi:MAG: SAM-dependent methyltransferase [Proteobacteria bacterium]|nr:SAM-dependent methyltransferase [Pseudomonadota bacterium]MBU1743016.1 SAM-dependent methyltransferase [Pseudomonadota bacterium]
MEFQEQQAPKVSVTALAVCVYRAIGAMDPDEKTRNPDYLAEKFIDQSPIVSLMGLSLNFAEAMENIRRTPPYLFFFVTARTKHIDATLGRELESGATQAVILGAGFDSRALRFHGNFPDVKFFEPDRPANQAIKRRLSRERIGPPPPTLVYVPLDFNTQTLGPALGDAG